MDTIELQKKFNKIKNGSIRGTCQVFAHSLLDFPKLGESEKQKDESFKKYGTPREKWNPRIGDVVLYHWKPYDHVSIIEKLNPLSVIDSNYDSDHKIGRRKINLKDKEIMGAIRPSNITQPSEIKSQKYAIKNTLD